MGQRLFLRSCREKQEGPGLSTHCFLGGEGGWGESLGVNNVKSFPILSWDPDTLDSEPGSNPELLTHDPRLITSLGPQFPPLRNGDNNRTSFLAMMASGQDAERKALFVQKAGSNSSQRVRGPVAQGG